MKRIPSLLVRIAFPALLLVAGGAQAACVFNDFSETTLDMAGTRDVIPSAVRPVGGMMYWYSRYFNNVRTIICDVDTPLSLVADDGQMIKAPGQEGRYETGVEGVELEIGFGKSADNGDKVEMKTGWQGVAKRGVNTPVPRKIVTQFMRSGSHVARSGTMTFHYAARLMAGNQTLLTFRLPGATFNFTNNVMLTSCYAENPDIPVAMGTVPFETVRRNLATPRDYAIDIRCSGTNGAATPVKTFFEGNVTADGILKLADTPASASGFGIAVTDAEGNPVPFHDRPRSLPSVWQDRIGVEDRYRFQGKARYVPLAGPLKAGSADAVMSFVLDYD
ncbi:MULTISPECIES: fimbrial protein [unclassified Pseudoxanthomonas]|uniref:fimbrial protein n=1 Tax=unclassified Pseudoxanthomonas TaxID=2645906 RepID=UPI0016170548|nr:MULTISPECIES: fimbrial protein [unclassified Pseudoxanthomonas]MBB3277744.1 type 1 fimbria pilin [Pseudoxanthomonas sp. OG2]MBV7474416.1 type 1 fimbrial protein [Pseudoxanthomonas sp. PXM05]